MSVTHATQLALGVVWIGSPLKTARSELAQSIIDHSAVATACGLVRHEDLNRTVYADSILRELPTCPDCLRLYQEALVMRDEHLMQWGEKE